MRAFIKGVKTICNHVRKRNELSGARMRTPVQHEGSDPTVPEDVLEDHGAGRRDTDMARLEGQDAW